MRFPGLRRYLGNVIIALDQLGNALKFGDPDETISSAEGRYDRVQPKTKAPTLTKILNWLDPGHSEKSIEYDQYGNPDPHHLDKSPPGAAIKGRHAFERGPHDPWCVALVDGVRCNAPVEHPVHGRGTP